jgi:hypothetical protein
MLWTVVINPGADIGVNRVDNNETNVASFGNEILERIQILRKVEDASYGRTCRRAAPLASQHRPGSRLRDDGQRHHGREQARPRLDLHDPASENCGRSEGSAPNLALKPH